MRTIIELTEQQLQKVIVEKKKALEEECKREKIKVDKLYAKKIEALKTKFKNLKVNIPDSKQVKRFHYTDAINEKIIKLHMDGLPAKTIMKEIKAFTVGSVTQQIQNLKGKKEWKEKFKK